MKNKITVSRQRSAFLTKTDEAILARIARFGFQNYRELRLGPLQNSGRSHSWVRMKKLVQMGYLIERRGDSKEILGWSLTKKGDGLFAQFSEDESWAVHSRAPSYRTSYHHDCVLRELQVKLEISPVIKKWIPEQKLRHDLMARFHYLHAIDKGEKLGGLPDALLHIHSGGQDSKAALELELSQKSRKRLYKKLEAHILSPDYDFVLYIIEGENLFSVLADAYSQVLEKSVRVKISRKQNEIYFALLSELQKNSLNAKFQGTQDSFSLADLAD